MIVEIKDHDGLVRDISSGAVLNTNRTAYENYIMRKEQQKKQKELIAQQADQINNLQNELVEIKQLLQILIREQNG